MQPLTAGRYRLRLAQGAAELAAAQGLRALAFRLGSGGDSDPFDPLCQHLLVEETSGGLLACLRVLPLAGGAALQRGYCAQFYDLSPLSDLPGPLLEVGRFCLHPGTRDPDLVRLLWAGLARLVEETGARHLIGCSSFAGTDWRPYAQAFALLRGHLAPAGRAAREKAPEPIRFAEVVAGLVPEPAAGLRALPPLLRSYLALGAVVSDHAVADPAMNTLHVLTLLDIAAIPPARAAQLRALAAQAR